MERGSLPVEVAIALIVFLGFVYLERVWVATGQAPAKTQATTQATPAPQVGH